MLSWQYPFGSRRLPYFINSARPYLQLWILMGVSHPTAACVSSVKAIRTREMPDSELKIFFSKLLFYGYYGDWTDAPN